MPEVSYINGLIMPIEKAVVPVKDRGYQFADAVYEFLVSYNGRLFALEEHLDRLERSMSALKFQEISRDTIRKAILDTHHASGIPRAGVYLQISRGAAPRNHAFPRFSKPHIIITVRELLEPPERIQSQGLKAITVGDFRWGRCDIQSVQLVANVLAKQQALDSGADDAIFIGSDGTVREGTASNLFIVSNNQLSTHPLTEHILHGITRAVVIDLCREESLTVQEKFFPKESLYHADEVFLTGSVAEVMSLTRINGSIIGSGRPGPIASMIYQKYRQRAFAPDIPPTS